MKKSRDFFMLVCYFFIPLSISNQQIRLFWIFFNSFKHHHSFSGDIISSICISRSRIFKRTFLYNQPLFITRKLIISLTRIKPLLSIPDRREDNIPSFIINISDLHNQIKNSEKWSPKSLRKFAIFELVKEGFRFFYLVFGEKSIKFQTWIIFDLRSFSVISSFSSSSLYIWIELPSSVIKDIGFLTSISRQIFKAFEKLRFHLLRRAFFEIMLFPPASGWISHRRIICTRIEHNSSLFSLNISESIDLRGKLVGRSHASWLTNGFLLFYDKIQLFSKSKLKFLVDRLFNLLTTSFETSI